MSFSVLISTIVGVSSVVSGLITILTYFVFLGKKIDRVDGLKEQVNKITEDLKIFREDLSALKEFKINAQKFIDNQIYKSKSPLTLTELGVKLVKESGFETIFEAEKDNLSKKLSEKEPQTKYDVQEKARALMDELTDYPPFQSIKDYAFESGEDFAQILRAGAILLRDYYISKHPMITKP